jgi:hypothetical protein
MASARITRGDQSVEVDGITARDARELAFAACAHLAGIITNTASVTARSFGFAPEVQAVVVDTLDPATRVALADMHGRRSA